MNGGKISLIQKKIADLTPQEYKQVYSLSFRNEGDAFTMAPQARSNILNGEIIRILEDNNLIAWVIFIEILPKHYDCYFYTRKSHRNQGFGSQLATKLKEILDKRNATWLVHPWDSVSSNFFYKNKLYVQKIYSFYSNGLNDWLRASKKV